MLLEYISSVRGAMRDQTRNAAMKKLEQANQVRTYQKLVLYICCAHLFRQSSKGKGPKGYLLQTMYYMYCDQKVTFESAFY